MSRPLESPAVEGVEALAGREMHPGDLLNIGMLKEAIEVEFIGSLWVEGDSGPMTPFVIDAVFGDGLHLLTISTINQRPNYWVVRVDSSWREPRRWRDFRPNQNHEIGDEIDAIIDAIEDECGRAGNCLDEPCDNCENTCCKCSDDFDAGEAFPEIDYDTGCSWGEIRWPWLMKTIGYTAQIERLRSRAVATPSSLEVG
jgi:hypothetical protein